MIAVIPVHTICMDHAIVILQLYTGCWILYVYLQCTSLNNILFYWTQVGDVIYLLDKVDKQFFEGELKNKVGRCPYSHVEIIVPLP